MELLIHVTPSIGCVNACYMQFRNPLNSYEEKSSFPWLWCLCFGSLYFAFKGIWTHAVISLVLVKLTHGVSWFIYPFFAPSIVRKHYLRRGWDNVQKGGREPKLEGRILTSCHPFLALILALATIRFVVN